MAKSRTGLLNSDMRAIVTDTHTRTAWCVARSLARRGIGVVGLRTRASRFDRSRYYRKLVDAPSLAREPHAWLDAAVAAGRPGDVLLPVSIAATTAIAGARERFARAATTPALRADQLALAEDKERTLALAAQLGLSAPTSLAAGSWEEAEKALHEIGLPLVVKLREEAHYAPAERFAIARDAATFRLAFRRLAARQSRPLVQRYVPGSGAGVALLAHEGRVCALFAHRRRREQTSDGGPSTWCEAVRSPLLDDAAHRFAEATGWTGLAMLEFRVPEAGGAPELLEINPRFWGSMPLAIACGVDFPYLAFELARRGRFDGPVVRATRFRRMKFPATDLVAACQGASTASEARAALREWSDPHLRLGLVDWRDPLVSAAELRDALPGIRRLARRAL